MNDNLTTCPCERQSDACYKRQVSMEVTNYICYGCGFQSNSLMKVGQEFYEEQLKKLPELYKDLIFEDKNGLKWMPSFFDIQGKGSVFVMGKNTQNWTWSAMKHCEVKENEKEMFKNPNGGYYKYKSDTKTLKQFSQSDFIEALDYIGMFENQEDED